MTETIGKRLQCNCINGFCNCGEKHFAEGIQEKDSNEILLPVSEEFASYSLGFAIDSGASLTKILYRSKKDYKNGRRIKNETGGLLRLKCLDEISKIIPFLKENCDVCINISTDKVNSESNNPPIYYQSGVGIQHFMNELDSAFNIRTKLLFEETANSDAFRVMYVNSIGKYNPGASSTEPDTTLMLKPLPVSLGAFQRSLHDIRILIQLLSNFQQNDIGESPVMLELAEESSTSPEDPVEPKISREEHAMKLLAQDEQELAQEMSVTHIQPPCLLVIIGSGMIMKKRIYAFNQQPFSRTFEDLLEMRREMLIWSFLRCVCIVYVKRCSKITVSSDGKQQMCDFNPCGGKMITNLEMQLTGAKNFKELINLASQGDPNKVNLSNGDLNKERTTVDFYSLLPKELTVFSLGKLTDKRYKDQYTDADLAAGLLKAYCHLITKLIVCNAKLYNFSTVVVAGSFVSIPLLREMIEESFYNEVLLLPFFGAKMIRMTVLEHSGFLCSLGVWQHNLDLERNGRQEEKENSTAHFKRSSL